MLSIVFNKKQVILASQLWSATKLELRAMFSQEFKSTSVHDRAENLGADIHEHDTSPFAGIKEVAILWDRDALAEVPLRNSQHCLRRSC
jgi:hypothetical protein